MADADVITKRCTRCGAEKPATREFFRKAANGLYGLRSRCIPCELRQERDLRQRRVLQPPPPVATKICPKCRRDLPAILEFFRANPNKRGGVQSYCKKCSNRTAAAHAKRRRATDPDFAARALAWKRQYYRNQREVDPEKAEAARGYTRKWKAAHPEYVRKTKQPPALVAFYAAKRRAAIIQATPAWADLEEIKALYERAARITEETGVDHHVDHIIPLRGRIVSGLHVCANLQIIPAKENIRKKNRFDPDLSLNT